MITRRSQLFYEQSLIDEKRHFTFKRFILYIIGLPHQKYRNALPRNELNQMRV